MESLQILIPPRTVLIYTHQEHNQGSWHYLQRFEGYRHIQCLVVVAAMNADRNVSDNVFVKVPTVIKAVSQAILKEYPVLGVYIRDSFQWNVSGQMQGIGMFQGWTWNLY